MDILLSGDGWVVMWFQDGTAQTVHTSLDVHYLSTCGAELKEGYFFDLEHLRYVPFRDDAVAVDVFKEKPVFESEVLNFASRFI